MNINLDLYPESCIIFVKEVPQIEYKIVEPTWALTGMVTCSLEQEAFWWP